MIMSRTVGEAPAELPCARCKQVKEISEFPIRIARGKSRYWSYCNECQNNYARDFRSKNVAESRRKANAYYQANAAHKQAIAREWRARTGRADRERAWKLAKTYGISLDGYQALLVAQGGVCAICKRPPRGRRKYLAVDHDHETGKIRGLLCTTCNVGLGALSDSPDLLRAALVYLAKECILGVAER